VAPFSATFPGELPPDNQLIKIPNQLVNLSQDLILFDKVPQHCTVHRLVIIRNINKLKPTDVDFNINEDNSSFLIRDGLLKIHPMKGVIEAGGQVLIHLTFHANSPPIIFDEKLRIICRESVKAMNRKKKPKKNIVFEKLQASKSVKTTVRESVVTRITGM
jgi:hypothetical protein